MDNEYLNIGNITTILNSIFLMVGGYLIGWLGSIGLNLPFNQAELGGLLTAIVLTIFSYINAKKHNNFFDKDNDTIHIPVEDLTDAQIQAIENFIAYNTPDKTTIEGKMFIEEIDPASEYEVDENE